MAMPASNADAVAVAHAVFIDLSLGLRRDLCAPSCSMIPKRAVEFEPNLATRAPSWPLVLATRSSAQPQLVGYAPRIRADFSAGYNEASHWLRRQAKLRAIEIPFWPNRTQIILRRATGVAFLAPLRHADCIEQCPLSGATRKTFAHTEFFSVW